MQVKLDFTPMFVDLSWEELAALSGLDGRVQGINEPAVVYEIKGLVLEAQKAKAKGK